MRNLITDVPGVSVGNVEDEKVATGVTAVIFDKTAVCSVRHGGGAPGSRDTTLLETDMTQQGIDAVVLSGGSLFGLDAAGGVLSHLREQGRGFMLAGITIPIVSQSIVFDLVNGGDKAWGHKPPYWNLGIEAARRAGKDFALGSAGGGYGATTANLKGGLGSASMVTASGYTVGAIVIVNAIGMATIGDTPHFWAAPYEQNREFGGLGWPAAIPDAALALRVKGDAPATTIALVATDALLTKAEAKRIAIMADDGLGKAIRPAHAAFDGDTIYAASTGRKVMANPMRDLTEIGLAAGDCLARAIARGVYEATALPFPGALPAWKDRFGP
ncbi:MAG TPA: P1 family peptidase [Beijerinckiaceae bacterium]|nr:P1 family peptidase [Beijerinckiaceae bacterium]